MIGDTVLYRGTTPESRHCSSVLCQKRLKTPVSSLQTYNFAHALAPLLLIFVVVVFWKLLKMITIHDNSTPCLPEHAKPKVSLKGRPPHARQADDANLAQGGTMTSTSRLERELAQDGEGTLLW
jgi:hypothetical protein